MIMYKANPGVVLGEICGEYLLVASREAREKCPYVTQINETSAFLWKQLEDEATFEDLLMTVKSNFEIDDEPSVSEWIHEFIDEMISLGYLEEYRL